MNLGSHVLLDCYGCSKDKLKDINSIFDFLESFPAKLKLTKIMPPSVFKYTGDDSHEWGVSGVVRVAESQISIHTFPEQEHVFVDIFSGKEFDLNLAREEVLRHFEARAHEEKILTSAATDLVGLDRRDCQAALPLYH